jgi:subtilisin
MIELQLSSSEKSDVLQKFPNAIISKVRNYEITSSETVPFQFSLIQATPQITTPYTGKGVKVAVIDSGIDTQHADIKVVTGICTLDVNCPTTTSYDDDNGHGTHVAGVIAARKNSYGLVGVAPDVELYAVKAMTRNGGGNTTDIAEGVDWAINQKVDIINLSLTTTGSDQALKLLIEKAYDEGITIVAAAGNEGTDGIQTDTVQYPAKYEDVIAVTATDGFKKKLSNASFGPEVELSAPGDEILSTYPIELDLEDGVQDGFKTFSGTSMATPHVTGIIALYKERFPSFTNKRLRELLTNTAEDLGEPGRDPNYGFGMVRYKQQITEIPYPKVSENTGKILISLQNNEEVKDLQLSINDEIVNPIAFSQWELYRLQGNYTFTLEYIDKNDVKQSDTIQVKVNAPSFKDVGNAKWYSPNIAYLSHRQLIYGMLDGNFNPDKLITRAEAVALIGRVYGLNGEQKTTVFKDVSANSFASGYIQSAYEEGLISGFVDGSFRPKQTVTRGEMAILLQNAYKLPIDSTRDLDYTDVSSGMVSYEAIQAMVQNGITKGFTATQFKPNEMMTRATYSVFISRAERNDLFK